MSFLFDTISSGFDALRDLVVGIVEWLISLLPASQGFPAETQTLIRDVWAMILAWDFIVPVATVITIIQILFYFEATMLMFKLMMFISKMIRGN